MCNEDNRATEKLDSILVPSVQVVLMREGNYGTEVFLGLRTAGGFLDQWSFPGGGIDKGENDVEAAIRKTREESGTEISQGSLSFLYDTQSSTVRNKGGKHMLYNYQIRVFTVNAQNLTPYNASPNEHSEMKWMTITDALSMHESAVQEEQALGVSRSPDKIPDALTPRTIETLHFITKSSTASPSVE
jgi:8-oxo-dGTP pyrophosphatase MutT (NUDIX family)